MRFLSLSSFVLVATALLAIAPIASAAPLGDRQIAQSLFDGARDLMANGEYAKACPMLVESQRLDPGGGTLLNLALCYEGEGKLATAQLELNDALAQAAREGRADREAVAREHLVRLVPRIPKIKLLAPAMPVAGLVVTLDGVTVTAAATGLSLPVDPGTHDVRAEAPGYVSWAAVERLDEGQTRAVQLPSLVRIGGIAEPGPAPRSEERAASPKTKMAPASWLLGGVGVVALAASITTGALALRNRSEFEKRCFAERSFCDNASDAGLADSARGLAWVSTGLIATAVVAGVAALLWPRIVLPARSSNAATHPLVIEF